MSFGTTDLDSLESIEPRQVCRNISDRRGLASLRFASQSLISRTGWVPLVNWNLQVLVEEGRDVVPYPIGRLPSLL